MAIRMARFERLACHHELGRKPCARNVNVPARLTQMTLVATSIKAPAAALYSPAENRRQALVAAQYLPTDRAVKQ